ncbi:MAG: choice-of-anchor J domain-containing protein [Bacteroidota bacterium]
MTKVNTILKSFLTVLLFLLLTSNINAQSYVEIGTGTVSASMPIYSSWNYSWSSLIYPQSGLGTAKTIIKISLNCTNGPKTVTNQKIYIKHSSSAIFSSNAYEDPTNNGYTLVYTGNLSFVNGWNDISITPFAYNGTDNLIIHWENSWGNTYGPNFNSTTSTTNNNKNCGSDTGFPTTSGTLNPYPSSLTNIRFYYNSTGPTTPGTPNPTDNQDKASVSTNLSFVLGTNTTNYDIYFGLDSLGVNGLSTSYKVVDNSTVSAPGTFTYTPSALLLSKTKYFWRVVAKNGTTSEISPLWKFTTQLVISTFPYSYGFEDSTVFYPGWYGSFTDWTYPTTGNNAIWNLTSVANAYSGNSAACASPNTGTTSSSLMTPRFIIPANYRISFWWKNADPQLKIANKDSTYFEISTNGGTSWTILDVLSPSIGMSAYINSIKDLSSYVGNNVYFRWRYNLSVASGYKNVYIDDIKVEPIPSGAIINLSETNYAFKELYVNGITKHKVIITNTGIVNLVISGVNVTAPYSCSYTGTILPLHSDTATIVFTATTTGTFNQGLTINTNSVTGNSTILLSGTVQSLLPSLYETFESVAVDTIPAHWNKLRTKDPYQTTNNISVKNSPTDAHSVPNVVKFYNNTDTLSPLMLITPGVTNFSSDTLKFWASKTHYNTAMVQLTVGLMDDPYDATSFVPTSTITLADSMMQYVITFNTSNTKPYIAFKHAQAAPSCSIWLDDVSWQSGAITVPNPVALVAPLNNSINNIIVPTLKWTDAGGSPTGYKLSLGTNNPPTNIINNIDLTSATSYPIASALQYNTTYYWQITPYNTNGSAVNCPVWNFKTMSDPTVYTLPWNEGFESVTQTSGYDYPLGWSIENGSSQSTCWDLIVNNTSNPTNAHSGQDAMHIAFSFLDNNNDWLFSVPIHLTGGTTYKFGFWYKTAIYISGVDSSFEKLEVKWGNAADSNAMTVGTIFNNNFMRFPNWTYFTSNITPTTTGNYTFGFHSYSDALQYLTFVDDVSLALANGIDENTNNAFNVYPNPTTGKFIIKLNDNNKGIAEISITNIIGQEVYRTKTNQQYINIDLEGLTKGMYLIKITSDNKQSVKKITKN